MTNEDFDEWALKTNWNAKPWWKRLWLSATGRGLGIPCSHSWTDRQVTQYESGKSGYYRHWIWAERFCPKCGNVGDRLTQPTPTVWKEHGWKR